MKIEEAWTKDCHRDPGNPRKQWLPEQKQLLKESIRLHGIKVPLIGYGTLKQVMIGDGNCRLECAIEIELEKVPVILFPQKPTDDELLLTQLAIQAHRAALNPVDEFEAFSRLAGLKGWSHAQLADAIPIARSEVTKTMALGRLSPEELQLVREEKISKSAAYALSRMSDEERAVVLSKAASGEVVRRDKLANQVRRQRSGDENKTRRVNCLVPGGAVSVHAEAGLDLDALVELLDGLLRACRKLRTQGLNIATAVRVLNDQANPRPAD